MTRGLGRSLAAATLLSALAIPAAAQDGMYLGLDVTEIDGQAWACVVIEHALDMPFALDVEYVVDGELVKVEPVSSQGTVHLSEPIGAADKPHDVCVVFNGEIRITSDTYRLTGGERCGSWMPRPSAARALGLSPRVPDRRLAPLALERPVPPRLSR